MNELESIVKNVVYGGIGAAATLVEKGADLARTLVEKGQETVRANQGTVDQIKETAEDLKQRIRTFCERFMDDGVIDASCLTREQRDAVRHQLDEQDELDRQAEAACTYDAPAAKPEAPVDAPMAVPAEAPAPVPTIEFPPEDLPGQEEPLSDDNVPVFEPEKPTRTSPDEV